MNIAMKLRIYSSIFALTLVGAACPQDRVSAEVGPADPAAEPAPAEVWPAGSELLAAHVEAAGGADKIAKFDTIHAEGTITVPSQKLTGTMQVWWKKTGEFYLEHYMEGIGDSRAGYDGEVIWIDDPLSGLRILDGQEAASYLQSSLMFPGHDWALYFKTATTLAKVETDDGPVWEVELASKQGVNTTIGLDAETKLIRYMKTTQVTPMGNMPIADYSVDYQPVEGYLFSMKTNSSISGLIELHEELTKLEINVPIDPAMFAFPATREQIPADPEAQPPVVNPKAVAPPAEAPPAEVPPAEAPPAEAPPAAN